MAGERCDISREVQGPGQRDFRFFLFFSVLSSPLRCPVSGVFPQGMHETTPTGYPPVSLIVVPISNLSWMWGLFSWRGNCLEGLPRRMRPTCESAVALYDLLQAEGCGTGEHSEPIRFHAGALPCRFLQGGHDFPRTRLSLTGASVSWALGALGQKGLLPVTESFSR